VPPTMEDANMIVPTQWAASSVSVLVDTLCDQMD